LTAIHQQNDKARAPRVVENGVRAVPVNRAQDTTTPPAMIEMAPGRAGIERLTE
jgi:hypothetical protein